jgi:hypothetical protein
MRIDIHTTDNSLENAIFPMAQDVSYGTRFKTDNGIEIESKIIPGRDFAGEEIVLSFIVTNVLSVGVGIVSNWIYDKICSRQVSLRIDGKDVTLNKRQIEAAISQALKSNES